MFVFHYTMPKDTKRRMIARVIAIFAEDDEEMDGADP
jgi:hypothetical protein